MPTMTPTRNINDAARITHHRPSDANRNTTPAPMIASSASASATRTGLRQSWRMSPDGEPAVIPASRDRLSMRRMSDDSQRMESVEDQLHGNRRDQEAEQ